MPNTSTARRAAAPRRVDLYTASRERIAAEVIGRSIRVKLAGTVAGARPYFASGTVERVENGRTVVRFTDGTWAYGPSGRVTVR